MVGTGHPQGPALTRGRAEELAAPGPVGKAFFFSSSIKYFPSLEPQGDFGWEATWLWCCWPRDASQDEGTSPWSPLCCFQTSPRSQQPPSHPASSVGWPGR